MKKKLLSVITVGALFTLVGCGSGDNADSSLSGNSSDKSSSSKKS